MKQPLEIKVSTPALSRAVQILLLNLAGIDWWGGTKVPQNTGSPYLHVGWNTKSALTRSELSLAKERPGAIFFDASAHMAELIEFLSPGPVIIKNVTKEYDGEIAADKSSVKVGCQIVSREKVKEIYDALFA